MMKKSKINVLQIVDKFAVRGAPIHGGARLLINWWPAFDESPINMSLCVLRASEGGGDSFRENGIDFIDLARGKFDVRTILDLVSLIRKNNIDILHCHGYGSTTFGRVAGFLTNRPVIVHEHMVDENMPLYQRMTDKFLSPMTTIGIAISKAVYRFMSEDRSMSTKKMRLVYNAIPENYIREYTLDQKRNFADEYGLDVDRPVIGIVGRLDPIKGHREFIAAAAKLSAGFPTAQFVIVGGGDIRPELEGLSEQLGCQGSVKFLGHQQDVLKSISLFDIFVCCSHMEGLGLVVAEAMALAKPVVGTRVGGIPEIVEDGVTGILVEPKNVDQLTGALSVLLNDSDLIKKMGEAGLDLCKEKFLVSSAARELTEIYRSLM